jgi:hypothetical protein
MIIPTITQDDVKELSKFKTYFGLVELLALSIMLRTSLLFHLSNDILLVRSQHPNQFDVIDMDKEFYNEKYSYLFLPIKKFV